MIVYIDSSALVKRYVIEDGWVDVQKVILEAEALGTCVISRTEVAAALSKAVRTKVISRPSAAEVLSSFVADWDSIIRIQLSESLCSRAAKIAWDFRLRGYDAVHLAAALFWSEQLDEDVMLATFDRALWKATRETPLLAWPEKL